MRLDHLSFAAGPDGLASTAQRIGGLLGRDFTDGGVHPRFGTRNMILPLADHTYLEIVEVLDHPASDKAPFGQAVRARSALGGGWLGWVVAVDDIATVEQRLGRESAIGNRHRPDGTELRWKQIGVNGLIADPQLPFFIAVGEPRRAAPQRRRGRGVLPGLPGDRRRPAAGQRVARRDRRGAARGREGRVGRAARHPRHHRRAGADPERPRPALSASRERRSPGAVPSPNIWHHTATYEVENRAVDPDGRLEAAMPRARRGRLGRARRARPRLRHRLPPAPLRRPTGRGSVTGVEPHADLAALARRRTRGPAARRRAPGHRAGAAAAGRVGRRRARAVGLLLRPRAASPGWPSWTASYAAAARRS